MSGHFEQGAWKEDPVAIAKSFMKVYFCVYEQENAEGQQLIDVQPIFRQGFGEEGTALRDFAKVVVNVIALAGNDRTEDKKIALREELRQFLKSMSG